MGSHREEKREEGDGDDQERGGGVERRETSLACDQFPECSPRPGTPKEIHRVKYGRDGGGS